MTELSPSLEDYLEAVYTLSRRDGTARACRVGALLNVSKPSVNSAMKALSARGLVRQERYGSIGLSAAGLKAGGEISGRHSLLKDFFTAILDMDAPAAEKDACRAEHALSREALRRVGRLASFMKAPARGRLLRAAKAAMSGRKA